MRASRKIPVAENAFQALKALSTRSIRFEFDRIPFFLKDVPSRKILNWILAEVSMPFRPIRPWAWPTHLQVEPSTYCNLKCALCPVTQGMNRPQGNMKFDTFKQVIDELAHSLLLTAFWDWGEPFLNPAIYRMIDYARKNRIKTISSTNGHPFANQQHAEQLVRSGLDWIIFAVDGISRDTYRRYRSGGDLDAVIKGIKNVVAVKQDLGSKLPRINLRFLPMKHNEHEIPRLEEFARSLGVDALTLKTLNPHGPEENDMAPNNTFVPVNPIYRRFLYDERTGKRIRVRKNPCKALWNNPVLHWNGRVSPCTDDPNDNYTMGDVREATFKSIWWGRPYRQFRQQFHRDFHSIDICRCCTNAFVGGFVSTDIIEEAQFFATTGQVSGVGS